MAVVNMVVGAVTDTGATFVAKVDGGGPVRVAVAGNSAMTNPVFTASQAVDGQGVAKVSIAGLAADTAYWWRVEDNSVVDTSVTGQFRTHPTLGEPANFTLGVGHCARGTNTPGSGDVLAPSRISNHQVFDTIRTRALADGWVGFAHLGDLHYYDLGSGNHGIVGGSSLANYRRAYDDVLLQSNQHALYRSVPWIYVWDDHDYGPNDSDGTHEDKANAAQAYRERVPHYPLPNNSGPVYQSFQIGRVLFIMSDTRYERSPNNTPDGPDKTMLGAEQIEWMIDLLGSTTASAVVWLMPSQWLRHSGADTWAQFNRERQHLIDVTHALGWSRRMVMCYGDRHALGLDTGSNRYGGWPVLLGGSLDSSAGGTGSSGTFDTGADVPGSNQYGTVTVVDNGSSIDITLAGWQGTTLWRSHTHTIPVPSPVQATGALLRTLSGSHRLVSEARVCVEFQTGAEPEGVELPVRGGDVRMDGTADVRATLDLATTGIDEATGQSRWPRHTGDLLAPYGNEIHVRVGVDMGDNGVFWVPLGYYRINAPDQDDSPYGEIRLACADRMAGVVDGRMLEPVEYTEDRLVGAVISELVWGIYPAAVILFDGDWSTQPLGRSLVVEESRFAALKDLANSQGKIMYWDGEGYLRFEDPPEEDVPVWEVKAGRGGVLVQASRRLTREGVYNAVVAEGEGVDDAAPVRAVAIDTGPNSPTRFGGRFGKVPRFYKSLLLTTPAQAQSAARAILRRSLGAPYSVDFQAVVNPTLRPFDPIRVTHRDGNREIHVLERVTIPLVPGRPMTGSTRQKTNIVVGTLGEVPEDA